MVATTNGANEVKADVQAKTNEAQSKEVVDKSTSQQSSTNASIKPVNPTDNPKAQQAFGFLRNVDNGAIYEVYRGVLRNLTEDENVKKYLPYAIKLLNLPSYSLPNKTISVKYNQETVNVNEEYFPKTIDEASLIVVAYLIRYAFLGDSRDYSTLLSGFTNSLSELKSSMEALLSLKKNESVRGELEKFVNVLDGYIKSWSQFKNEYPDPKPLKKEVVKMATADATQTGTQTGGQAGSIFSNLLDAVYGILGSIVDALKNYATEIAEVLVAGMLGYSVIRYGRQMINGLVNMVSTLF